MTTSRARLIGSTNDSARRWVDGVGQTWREPIPGSDTLLVMEINRYGRPTNYANSGSTPRADVERMFGPLYVRSLRTEWVY